MIKSIKKFGVDYYDSCIKGGFEFLKKHWKGYIALCGIVSSLFAAIIYRRCTKNIMIDDILEEMEEAE